LPSAVMIVCHCGPLAEAETALEPIKKFGSPILDSVGPTSYEETNKMLDAGFPRGALNYWKSNFMKELSDQALETLISHCARCSSPMRGLLLEHIHGAATRVGVSETAFPHRREGYNFLGVSEWLKPDHKARNTYGAQ